MMRDQNLLRLCLFGITAGEVYTIHWTDYWSAEPFAWTLEEFTGDQSIVLNADGGPERAFLTWNPNRARSSCFSLY